MRQSNPIVWQRSIDEKLRYQPRLLDGRVLIRSFGQRCWSQPKKNQLNVLYRSRDRAIRIAVRTDRDIKLRDWSIHASE